MTTLTGIPGFGNLLKHREIQITLLRRLTLQIYHPEDHRIEVPPLLDPELQVYICPDIRYEFAVPIKLSHSLETAQELLWKPDRRMGSLRNDDCNCNGNVTNQWYDVSNNRAARVARSLVQLFDVVFQKTR